MFEHDESLLSQKKLLKIVIFGPYAKGGFDRLKVLQKHLCKHGYDDVHLVDDLPDPPNAASLPDSIFTKRKSEYWVQHADVLLFVFYKNINHGSVTVEMKELADKVHSRIKCASFFVECGEKLETLEKAVIMDMSREYADFNDDDDLNDLAETACWNHIVEDDCLQ